MQESLLQYIWQFQLYNQKNLTTTDGQEIVVLQPGKINRHAGPDFQNARIKIGETEWAGTVEIHRNSEDWFTHNHHTDDAFNNVILHVVLSANKKKSPPLPTLELEDRIPQHLHAKYRRMMEQLAFIPCEHFLPTVNTFSFTHWKGRMLTERLEEKTIRIHERLKETNHDWNQVFYEQLAYNFGLRTNADAFLEVAKRLPLLTLRKYHNNHQQIDALLFGMAGFLASDFTDRYPNQLQKEFQFLQKKHNLLPISKTNWNFGRIRPASFPTLRMAQFSRLVFQSKALFSKLMEVIKLKDVRRFFSVEPTNYWKTHYIFDKESTFKQKRLGKTMTDRIIINTVVPFQFLVGKEKARPELQQQAIELLEQLPKETNRITKQWEKLGIEHQSAFDSQALLYLHKNYCQKKRCLECGIGHEVLKSNTT